MRDMGVKAVTCPICPMLRRVMTRWSIDEGGVQCVFAFVHGDFLDALRARL